MLKKVLLFIPAVLLIIVVSIAMYNYEKKARVEATFKEYVQYFKSAYDIMDKNYYVPVSRELFDAYVADFRSRIFNLQVKDKSKVDNGTCVCASGKTCCVDGKCTCKGDCCKDGKCLCAVGACKDCGCKK